MSVLIHDTLATLLYTAPVRLGLLAADVLFEIRDVVTAKDVNPDQAALIPSAEIAHLTGTHLVAPDVAVVFSGEGPIAMRTPVRPDEVDLTPVALNGVSGTAEVLARATLQPFYGIRVSDYFAASDAATVSLLEGAATLLPVEAGFQESLVRAWFILTGQPVVSHLLVTPKSWSPERNAALSETMTSLRTTGHDRRSELRAAAAADIGVERDLLVPLFAGIRYRLDDADRRALIMLLQHGNRGSSYPYVWTIDYFEAVRAGE